MTYAVRLLTASLILVACGSLVARAQTPTATHCEGVLAEATLLYTEGLFEVVLARLQPCAEEDELPREVRRSVHRLILLSHLRLNDYAAARATLNDLLAADPLYEPDPVLDPPDLVAFVAAERRRAQPVPETPPVEEPAVMDTLEPLDARRPIFVTGRIGGSSYGGERGINRDSRIADFAANIGLSAGVQVAVPVSPLLEAGGRLQVMYLHTRFAWDVPVPVHRSDSSAWALLALAEGSASWPVHEYLATRLTLGVGGAFSYLNRSVRPGLAIQPGIQVETPVRPDLALVFATELTFVVPGDALDLSTFSVLRDRPRRFDLLTHIGLGARYRF